MVCAEATQLGLRLSGNATVKRLSPHSQTLNFGRHAKRQQPDFICFQANQTDSRLSVQIARDLACCSLRTTVRLLSDNSSHQNGIPPPILGFTTVAHRMQLPTLSPLAVTPKAHEGPLANILLVFARGPFEIRLFGAVVCLRGSL